MSEGGLSPLLCPNKTHLGYWVQVWASQCKEDMDTPEWAQRRWPIWLQAGAHDEWGEGMRLGNVCLQEKELTDVCNCLTVEHRDLWIWSLKLALLWAEGWSRRGCPFLPLLFFFLVVLIHEAKDRDQTHACWATPIYVIKGKAIFPSAHFPLFYNAGPAGGKESW